MIFLHLNKFYRPAGGAEAHLFALEKYLTKAGHAMVPFAMADPRNKPTPYAEFFTRHVEFGAGHGLSNALRMAGMFWSLHSRRQLTRLLVHLAKHKRWPAAAHCHNLYHQLTPSVLPLLKKAGIPVVMTVHDMHFFGTAYAEGGIEDALCTFELALHKRLKVFQKNVDIMIAPSRFTERQLIHWGFPGRRIAYLPHAVEPLPKPKEKITQKPFLHLIFVGRLAHEKGVKHLLEALTLVPNTVTATIVGDGPLAGQLKIYAGQLKLGARVAFAGHKTGLDLSREILKGHATLVPSSVPEVFGLTMAEAFSLGKPVLAFNHGAAPEIITPGKTGWLVEPTTAALAHGIREIMHSKAKLPAMARAAHAEVKKYQYRDYIPRLLEVYKTARASHS